MKRGKTVLMWCSLGALWKDILYGWFQGKTPAEQSRDGVGRIDRRLGRMEVLKEWYLLPLYLRTFIAVVFAGKGRLVVNSREGTELCRFQLLMLSGVLH